MEKYYENKNFQQLTEEYVKSYGKSDNIRGELIRAVNQICYRHYNDGDFIGYGYGNETCNCAGRYIIQNGNNEMKSVISEMWDESVHDSGLEMDDGKYKVLLSKLVQETVIYADGKDTVLNNTTCDMWDFSSEEDCNYDKDYNE